MALIRIFTAYSEHSFEMCIKINRLLILFKHNDF